MSLYKQFKTDDNLERTGILLQYGVNERNGEPITIRVARAGGSNSAYLKKIEAKVKPFRRQIQNETIEKPVVDKMLRETYAESVVLGWENVDDKQGNPLPFTVQNCIQLFEELPDLFTDVQEQAQKAALFRADVLEADSKN